MIRLAPSVAPWEGLNAANLLLFRSPCRDDLNGWDGQEIAVDQEQQLFAFGCEIAYWAQITRNQALAPFASAPSALRCPGIARMPHQDRGLLHGLTNYGDREFSLYLRRSFAQSMGYSRPMLQKPVVGIAMTSFGFNGGH